MKSIFLSHTTVDKPFVEKLARDLERIGINVWFDKWSIKVGESITWKIENGIRENEYLGIVLSPEALESEWVKTELSAAWVKQMKSKKVFVLPILYRDCEIPLFLADKKYADFREDYDSGLSNLASVFGIKQTKTISLENWRLFISSKESDWKKYRLIEFEELITILIDRAYEYKWSAYVGGASNQFSVSFYVYTNNRYFSISIKLKGKDKFYWGCINKEINPNRLNSADFNVFIGKTINACEEFLWRYMEDFKKLHGVPDYEPEYYVYRFSKGNEVSELASDMLKKFSWYKGAKKIRSL